MVTWTRDDAAPFVALRHKGKPFGGIFDDVTTIVATRSFISGPSKTLATTLRKAGHHVLIAGTAPVPSRSKRLEKETFYA